MSDRTPATYWHPGYGWQPNADAFERRHTHRCRGCGQGATPKGDELHDRVCIACEMAYEPVDGRREGLR